MQQFAVQSLVSLRNFVGGVVGEEKIAGGTAHSVSLAQIPKSAVRGPKPRRPGHWLEPANRELLEPTISVPAMSLTTEGKPAAIASTRTAGIPSDSDGYTKTSVQRSRSHKSDSF